MVTFNHVNEAFGELYNSKTSQLLRSLRKYEVLIVIAIYLELLIRKSEKVLIDSVYQRCQTMITTLGWDLGNQRIFTSNVFKEIVKRLHSFGLVSITVENNKIADNIHLQLFVYQDEIMQAFHKNEILDKFESTISLYSGNKDE